MPSLAGWVERAFERRPTGRGVSQFLNPQGFETLRNYGVTDSISRSYGESHPNTSAGSARTSRTSAISPDRVHIPTVTAKTRTARSNVIRSGIADASVSHP